jgi:hypothetical protein
MRRLLDLLQVVHSGYYHPAMKGSFSIKQVVPTLCSELVHAVYKGCMACLGSSA